MATRSNLFRSARNLVMSLLNNHQSDRSLSLGTDSMAVGEFRVAFNLIDLCLLVLIDGDGFAGLNDARIEVVNKWTYQGFPCYVP